MADDKVKIIAETADVGKPDTQSVEAYMAKLRFQVHTIFPIGKGKCVDMDFNGDGVLQPQEALDALAHPDVKAGLPQIQQQAMAGVIERNPGKPLTSLQTSDFEMRQIQVIRMEDGSAIQAIKGMIPDADLKLLDHNKDDKVTVGEFQYTQLQHMKGKQQGKE